MASDYQAIRRDNERRYGTDIGRIGPMLLSERYADRTHFIYELLQNTEDALARRNGWRGSRAVRFDLANDVLRVGHFGHPFDEADVRGICGILESTKDLTAIGRFGIGFKSVYAFTDRPEIHSGAEDFAIESFVWPTTAPPLSRESDETVILMPLKTSDQTGRGEISAGFRRLGASALLFLRQIEEMRWSIEDGQSGIYLRDAKEIDPGVRRVMVIGQEHEQPEVDETWLVFSRRLVLADGRAAGHVEIAFSMAQSKDSTREVVQRAEHSPLVVFFPTVLETHLGFMVQGPYRTTPSRDNVPRNDPWNQRLVGETASLLTESLRWLRDHDLLDVATLQCLPIDPLKFGETAMFAPLFKGTKQALLTEPLLPKADGGHVPASHALLGRTQELRELFTQEQLRVVFGKTQELHWLTGDITQDRTPALRWYLMQELGIGEVTPEMIVPRLQQEFLEAQPDEWILRLYGFFNGQPALTRRLADLPLIRLENGTHVSPRANGQVQAFLPSSIQTSFPTVRRAVCSTEDTRKFLRTLGLTEPDPVDDVIWNILPKYAAGHSGQPEKEYETDIRRILTAFRTDSKAQRDKLTAALRDSCFLRAVGPFDGAVQWSRPNCVYLATERLKSLFSGVGDVLLVDDSCAALRGEDIRELLEACGASRCLQPIPVAASFTWEQRYEMRRAAGCENSSRGETLDDFTLQGLEALLATFPELDAANAAEKAALLWQALGELEERRGRSAFTGEYRWFYFNRQSCGFDATFVRRLNETAWVPDAGGELQRPQYVMFDTLGWKPDPFLLSKIRFKPPIIETLAKEVGIEPGVLDLLKKLGVTSEADLKGRLGIKDEAEPPSADKADDVDSAIKGILGETPQPTPAMPDPLGPEPHGASAGAGGQSPGGTAGAGGTGSGRKTSGAGMKRSPGSPGGRPFVSYVAAHPTHEDPDPDGLDHEARMALEEKAIEHILKNEPELKRTPARNPGYDLFEADQNDQPTRWVEVKGMTGDLTTRPIGLSDTQFECAGEHGEAYWLYVVEHAGTDKARIVRIQDPAGKARTFTFDHGWLAVAQVDEEETHESPEPQTEQEA